MQNPAGATNVTWHLCRSAAPFEWFSPVPEGTEAPANPRGDIRVPVCTSRTGVVPLSCDSYPYKFFGSFLHCIRGRLVVAVLDGATVGQSADLDTWVKSRGTAFLSKSPVWLVRAGESVWLPFATLALITAVPSDKVDDDLEVISEKKMKATRPNG